MPRLFSLNIFLQIFFVFVNMGPYRRQNFKTLLLPQMTLLSIFFLNFLLIAPHKSTLLDLIKFKFLILQEFLSFSLTWDPMGAKTYKNTTPPSNHCWICSTFSWIFFSVVLTKVLFWIFSSAELMLWGLCPVSVVRRPCRNYLRTYWADCFQISVMASPGPYTQSCFEVLKTKMHFQIFEDFVFLFVLIMLTWDPMVAKTSKCYSSLKSLLNLSHLFWIFLSVVLAKIRFWILEILSFWFFTICFSFSLTWDPMAAKNSKC